MVGGPSLRTRETGDFHDATAGSQISELRHGVGCFDNLLGRCLKTDLRGVATDYQRGVRPAVVRGV